MNMVKELLAMIDYEGCYVLTENDKKLLAMPKVKKGLEECTTDDLRDIVHRTHTDSLEYILGEYLDIWLDEDESDKNEIRVEINGGYLVATASPDSLYPGIWIEFIKNDELKNPDAVTNKMVLVEQPLYTNYGKGDFRVLLWEDEKNEDYTTEIIVRNNK